MLNVLVCRTVEVYHVRFGMLRVRTSSRAMLKFLYEVDELRAVSGHMLKASRVQILENNLDNLHSRVEEDGTLEIVDPQDLLDEMDLVLTTLFLLCKLGCDLLALVSKFTTVEESTGLLETTFVEDVVLIGVLPDEGICSVNLICLLLFTRVTAISLEPKSLMQGQ
nr:hypothetical protein [Tanacetum cinerariifolium]